METYLFQRVDLMNQICCQLTCSNLSLNDTIEETSN